MLGVFGDPAVTGKSGPGRPARGQADRDDGAGPRQRRPRPGARLRDLFGNPDLDPDGAAELRRIIVDTGALDRIEQMIKVRTDAALAALGDAPVSEEAFVELTALAAEAVDRATLELFAGSPKVRRWSPEGIDTCT